MKLSRVLAEIQKQTGNNIAAMPQAAEVPAVDPEIKVEFDKTPFWSALDQVLDQRNYRSIPTPSRGRCSLCPAARTPFPARAVRRSLDR